LSASSASDSLGCGVAEQDFGLETQQLRQLGRFRAPCVSAIADPTRLSASSN
jgi:hypothetical protein